MTIEVQLFALVKQLAGRDRLALDLPEGATVGELRASLAQAIPGLQPLAGQLMFAVNQAYVGDQAVIEPRAEVACIPPVSGG